MSTATSTYPTTLIQVFIEYVQIRKVARKTYVEYRNDLYRYLGDWLRMPLSAITPEMIRQRHRAVSKYAPVRSNRCFSLLRSLFKLANDIRTIPYSYPDNFNPVSIISTYNEWNKETINIDAAIELHDLRSWLLAVIDCGSDCVRDMLLLMVMTGLRVKEARLLEWSDVDLDRGILYVGYRKDNPTKTGIPHKLPLSMFLVQLLRRRLLVSRSHKYIFENPKTRMPIVNPYKTVNQIEAKSGVAFSPRWLRKTFTNVLDHEEIQANEKQTKQLINHRDSVLLRHYNRGCLETKRLIVEKVTRLVLSQLGDTVHFLLPDYQHDYYVDVEVIA